MKKIIGTILSLAAVVTLSSFVIAHHFNNDKTDNAETISANDGWEYYKTVTVYRSGGQYDDTWYVFKKTVCGDPDYILSSSKNSVTCESSISKNYNYGKDVDWTSQYKYTATLNYSNRPKGYFNCYLQGWDR